MNGRRAGALLLLGLISTACIKVPVSVKASFCAQPAPANHFGSGESARFCCPTVVRMRRFGPQPETCPR